jgi:hypothetical protein
MVEQTIVANTNDTQSGQITTVNGQSDVAYVDVNDKALQTTDQTTTPPSDTNNGGGGYDYEGGGGETGGEVITNPCQMHGENPIETLLYAVLCVFKRLLRVLKKHAEDIAMVVIGAMLGGSIVRFGRRMFRGITSIVRV